MSKTWVNSSELAGVTDGFVCLNYVEGVVTLGLITRQPGEVKTQWFCNNCHDTANDIDKAKEIVELMNTPTEGE